MSKTKIEFGDFQTPTKLTNEICNLISDLRPQSFIEPTCGTGNFLFSALRKFKTINKAVCLDINKEYTKVVKRKLKKTSYKQKVRVFNSDYFQFDWTKIIKKLDEPLLIIGNLPWVSNSKLSVLNSSNLPEKRNFQNRKGIEAITGKSNFDISEWIMIDMVNWLQIKEGYLAMLCKTSVARKLLEYIWTNNMRIKSADIYPIDAKKHFDVSVDACLLKCVFVGKHKNYSCDYYQSTKAETKKYEVGFADNQIVADLSDFIKLRHLQGEDNYKWRSGIKHDNSKVMELTVVDNYLVNGFGEKVEIEKQYLYPLLKSSDLVNGNVPRKWMIVTQKKIGQDTNQIKDNAPKTWKYLNRHQKLFEKRKSSIYKNKPPFSIFGVGEYSFKPYKIAISGLYKQLKFNLLRKYDGKPIVLDDTSYFLSFDTLSEAKEMHKILQSPKVKSFYDSLIFWESKRPITSGVLEKLNLEKLTR